MGPPMYCTADCITQVLIAGHISGPVWNQFCYKGFVREKSHTERIFINAFYLLWSDRAIWSSFACCNGLEYIVVAYLR